MDIEAAVDCALDAMSEDFALKKLLIANKAEVKQMCITEYDEAETMEQFSRDDMLREEGREEERLDSIRNLVELSKNLGQTYEKTRDMVLKKYPSISLSDISSILDAVY